VYDVNGEWEWGLAVAAIAAIIVPIAFGLVVAGKRLCKQCQGTGLNFMFIYAVMLLLQKDTEVRLDPLLNRLEQEKTPLFDAVKNYINAGTIPFHVPGHKQGRGLQEFKEFIGANALAMDLTCMPDLDNIINPTGAIKKAQELAAQTFGADHAYFLVNGTTCGIQAMIMAVCQPGDKLILPRNAHKSAVGGLILSGANPVYLSPQINRDFGFSVGITPEQVERALREHPDAKGVFVVNPTYYGAAPDLKAIVEIAKNRRVPVIVDEAHGAHFCFSPKLPLSAMEAGADLAASSTHKLTGSMAQSSILFLREGLISPQRVKAVLNITQTTSPSYLLLASLDVARKQMALQGKELLQRTLKLATWAREEIRAIKGLSLMDERVLGPGCVAFDPTKVTVNVQGLGMSGYELESILRRQYGLQVELADLYNVIFLLTIADSQETVSYLVDCLTDVANKRSNRKVVRFCPPLPPLPEMSVLPREAFNSQTTVVDLWDAAGEISAESIMAYPPGIPLICPGERLTREIIEYVAVLRQENADLQGTEDPRVEKIKVLRHGLTLVEPNMVDVG
jgi:arginine/lysine/ornithine decarboxylase